MQSTVQELQKESQTFGKVAFDKLKREYELKDEEVKQAQSQVQKLTFQLEDRQATQSNDNANDVMRVQLERTRIQVEELHQENAELKRNAENAGKALKEMQSLKAELEDTKRQLVQKHQQQPQQKQSPPKVSAEVLSLREALQRETMEKNRIETDNLRLMEKIRLLNARRSVSEAESGVQFDLRAFKGVTLGNIARTAFVNGSMTKKFVSFYVLLLHLILFYKLIL